MNEEPHVDRSSAPNGQASGSAPGPKGEGRAATTWMTRARRLAMILLDLVPGLRRTLTEFARVEIIDRAMIIAAQTLFSVTPLLIVLASFSPHAMAKSLGDQFGSVMGFHQVTTTQLEDAATAQQVRTQTGVAGLVLVVVSALSFARAMQRMYERVWELDHRGGLRGSRRCLYWLVTWVAYLQALALLASLFSAKELSPVRLLVVLALSTLAWWWTARTLLLGRAPWANLLLGAALTGVALTIFARLSRVFMPAYVEANVAQFGRLGIIFAASTWLLIFGGVLVVAAVLGRVYTEELRLGDHLTRWVERRREGRRRPDVRPMGG